VVTQNILPKPGMCGLKLTHNWLRPSMSQQI
jgi:hypothetical protein